MMHILVCSNVGLGAFIDHYYDSVTKNSKSKLKKTSFCTLAIAVVNCNLPALKCNIKHVLKSYGQICVKG